MTTYCDSPTTLRLEILGSDGTVAQSLDLMDEANGYRVSSLDVGFPTVRASVSARPTRDGDYDVTSLYGPRPVTIVGTLVPTYPGGVLLSRQSAMQALAQWCQPRWRPRLVYAYDADCAPMFLNLRGDTLAAPATNPLTSAFTVSWVAYDPVARAFSGGPPGPLASPLTVLPGATGTATNRGTYRAWPVFDIYGPCANPVITWVSPSGGVIAFTSAGTPSTPLTIAAGHFLEVDTDAQTAQPDGTADRTQSLYNYIDFANTHWAGFEPGATEVQFSPASPGTGCQLVMKWADSSI